MCFQELTKPISLILGVAFSLLCSAQSNPRIDPSIKTGPVVETIDFQTPQPPSLSELSSQPKAIKPEIIEEGSEAIQERNFDFEPDHLVVFFKATAKNEKRTILHECRIGLDSPLIAQQTKERFTSIEELVDEIATGASDWAPQGRKGFSEDIHTISMVNLTELKSKKAYSVHKYEDEQGESVRENDAAKELVRIAQILCH